MANQELQKISNPCSSIVIQRAIGRGESLQIDD
jgi:hypothetical protein